MVSASNFQQCRTMMLLRTLCLVFNAIVLVQILKEDLFSVLDGDAITMERWDPSDIIASPFPLENLQLVVSKSCRSIMMPTEFLLTTILLYSRGGLNLRSMLQWYSIQRIAKYTVRYLYMMVILNLFVLGLAIMCGASPTENLYHTVLATAYFTILAFGYIQPSVDGEVPLSMTLERVVLSPDYGGRDQKFKESLVNEMNGVILYAVFFITIPFMVLNVLDHGEQNQRWPLPIILGGLCGHLLGVGSGTIIGVYRLYRLRSGKAPYTPTNKTFPRID